MRLPALAESLWHSHFNRARIAPIAPGIDSQMTYVVHQGEEGEIGT